MNKKIQQDKLIEALKTVYDPEIPVDIYELGLIYDVFLNENNDVKVLMTLTTPNCPVADSLPEEVKNKIKEIPQVNEVEIEMTFDPPWSKDLMSDCLLYTSPSPRDLVISRMPSSA